MKVIGAKQVIFCLVSLLLLTSCVTGRPFSVANGYDEKKNVDITAAVFRMNGTPSDVLQIYRDVGKSDGKVSYGIYNSFRDYTGYRRPQFSVAAFIIDGTRTDFFSKSFGNEDVSESPVKTTWEGGYFFANKPLLGSSYVASAEEQITDPDPDATNAAVVSLVNRFKSAHSITIKLFGDRTDMPHEYSYVATAADLVALKEFCDKLASAQ